MKLSNGVIDALVQRTPERTGPLARLAAERMNVQAALRVRAVMRALTGPHADFIAVRDGLVAEYGSDGGISPTHERWAEFLPHYVELLNAEVEVEVEPLNVADLWQRIDGERVPLDLSPDEVELLGRAGALTGETGESNQ